MNWAAIAGSEALRRFQERTSGRLYTRSGPDTNAFSSSYSFAKTKKKRATHDFRQES